MEDVVSLLLKAMEKSGAPEILKCGEAFVGHHGTCETNARAILRSRHFNPGYGRMGPGVYFYSTAPPQRGIEAALKHAIERFRYDAEHGTEVVVEAKLQVEYLLDLDSEKNHAFVKRMLQTLARFVFKNCPRDTWKIHPHYVGSVLQELAGRAPGLERVDGIRSHFAYDETGSAESGLVVFNPGCIGDLRLTVRCESC